MRRNVTIGLARLGTAAALLGFLLLVPAPALAQDDVTLTMARERFKEGVAYFDKKDFAKARVAFLQAYALKKHPAVLLNLAQSELRSGHEADAAKHFAQYLREHKDATEAERQGAETGLTAAKALVAEVALSVDTTGAEVYVDGDLEGQAPLPGSVYLAPGAHEIQARKDDKSATTTVNAAAGQTSSVSLKLAAPMSKPAGVGVGAGAEHDGSATGEPPVGAAPSHRKAFFPWLVSRPGAMIGVGLAGVGLIGGGAFALGSKSAYDAADSVAAGIEDVAVRKDGKYTCTVNPVTGMCEAGTIKPDAHGACVNPKNWLTNRSTTFEGSDSALIATRAAQYEDNCSKYEDNVKSGDTYKTLAIVGFAVGGAAVVGTVIYYLVDSKESGDGTGATQSGGRKITFLPMYEPGFTGALVSGSF
jgi:hypothetical protein